MAFVQDKTPQLNSRQDESPGIGAEMEFRGEMAGTVMDEQEMDRLGKTQQLNVRLNLHS